MSIHRAFPVVRVFDLFDLNGKAPRAKAGTGFPRKPRDQKGIAYYARAQSGRFRFREVLNNKGSVRI